MGSKRWITFAERSMKKALKKDLSSYISPNDLSYLQASSQYEHLQDHDFNCR